MYTGVRKHDKGMGKNDYATILIIAIKFVRSRLGFRLVHAINCCRICGSHSLVRVLDLGYQALTGRFPRPDEADPMGGPVELALCQGPPPDCCGLLQLRHSFPLAEMYGATYGYRSSNNRSMFEHLRNKIRKLVSIARPAQGDYVLDIGANDGTTLKFYDGLGLRRFGIDPSSARYAAEYPKDTRLIVDFFSGERVRREVGSERFKIITSIAMFYDLEDPFAFMQEVAGMLAPDGIWESEQCFLPEMMRRCAYDSVCHEHISYYSLRQIKWMTDRAGLKIIHLSVNGINGGSFSVVAAPAAAPYAEATAEIEKLLTEETALGLHAEAPYWEFAARVAQHRSSVRAFLDGARRADKLVLGYGASTKGNVVLQYCGVTPHDIPAIADKYPMKFGLVTPGTRLPILPEVECRARNPDYLMVLPWYFRDEIIQREQDYLRAGGVLVFVLPELEQVSAQSLGLPDARGKGSRRG